MLGRHLTSPEPDAPSHQADNTPQRHRHDCGHFGLNRPRAIGVRLHELPAQRKRVDDREDEERDLDLKFLECKVMLIRFLSLD